uniref:Uncharacterized protein n=1 Tax=Piliocolobus tephrosceles TaxID=591936 RepID=A0A8C9H020_9PRIM
MRYHLIPLRMTIIKKLEKKRCWRGYGEIGTLLHCWWDCKLVQPLWKTVWRFLKDLELEIPFDPAIPLPGIYTTSNLHPDISFNSFIQFLIIKNLNLPMKQTECPSMDKLIKKLY